MINIIVVDDHEFFRKGLVLTINRFKWAQVMGEASNGIELLNMLERLSPDIILMDIIMPEMDGVIATGIISKKYKKIKIAALSMYGDEEYLKQMIDAGIVGFLLKNITKDELNKALLLISEGKNYYSPELLPFFTSKYLRNESSQNDHYALTKRELEIVKLIAEGKSNKEIADLLVISVRTVTNHRANIMAKTGVKNSAGLIYFAMKNKIID
jgi:two-component system, NarL family, response regulator DegU